MGESRAMRELKALIASVAPTEANVMVLGENGVGKELVARAIHAASRRAVGTLLAVDMGALPESTLKVSCSAIAKDRSRMRRPTGRGAFRRRVADRCFWTR
jgi:DNA-binding NtrC family response regulator